MERTSKKRSTSVVSLATVVLMAFALVYELYGSSRTVSRMTTALVLPAFVETATTKSSNTLSWHNEFGLVHVLHTRFQQKQPHLLHLGRARLQLFQEFCLPTILQQTTRSFVWIIRTDPDLHPELREGLLQLVKEYPHILVVASNRFPDGFRYQAIDKMEVWSGSLPLLQSVHRAAQTRPTLETRLDADDGLTLEYLETVQKHAFRTKALWKDNKEQEQQQLQQPQNRSTTASSTSSLSAWRVWCADSILEWQHYSMVTSATNGMENVDDRGEWHPLQPNLCVTPGLTWGYAAGTKPSDRPTGAHDKIYRTIPQCQTEGSTHCHERLRFSRWDNDDNDSSSSTETAASASAAIRARTPTSAGMSEIVLQQQQQQQNQPLTVGERGLTTKTSNSMHTFLQHHHHQQDAWWRTVESKFGLRDGAARIRRLRADFERHMRDILIDAVAGQCIPGGVPGTCKRASTVQLQGLLEQLEGGGGPIMNATATTLAAV